MRYFILIFVIAAGLFSCKKRVGSGTAVRFELRTGQGKTVYLSRFMPDNMSWRIIDTLQVKDGNASLTFHIRDAEQNLYKVSISGTPFTALLINDVPEINMQSSVFTASPVALEGSPLTNRLRELMKHQTEIAEEGRQSHAAAMKPGVNAATASNELARAAALRDLFYQQYLNVADSTQNAALFLWACIYADPGNDPVAFSKRMMKAAERFPSHTGVQAYVKKSANFLKIMQEEWQVGDALPAIQLPDLSGQLQNLATGGTYTWVDFWSPIYPPSHAYDRVKLEAYRQFGNKLKMTSIALHDNAAECQAYAGEKGHAWQQLIDVKMWDGPAAQAYKMDSIPFNFLVSPQGKIVAKAIRSDSVLTVLKNYLQ